MLKVGRSQAISDPILRKDTTAYSFGRGVGVGRGGFFGPGSTVGGGGFGGGFFGSFFCPYAAAEKKTAITNVKMACCKNFIAIDLLTLSFPSECCEQVRHPAISESNRGATDTVKTKAQ